LPNDDTQPAGPAEDDSEDLRSTEKLRSLLSLVGRIAHDFNNLLTVINGYSDLLVRDLEANPDLLESGMEIRTAGARAAELALQLTTLGQDGPVQTRPLDLNRLIEEGAETVRRLAGKPIELLTNASPLTDPIAGDPEQMHQLFVNCGLYARDVLPAGGTLSIGTSPGTMKAGDGTEIPCAQLLIRTTPAGRGPIGGRGPQITGMSLATIYGIVQQFGGAMAFGLDEGGGGTLQILLPLSEATAPVFAGKSLPLRTSVPGTETVLVVEDQEAMRKLAVRILERGGYNVLEAPDGREAVRLAAGYQETIALLLTDVVLPGMSGSELTKELVENRPWMKVVYMSGFAAEAIARRGLLEEGVPLLVKPFSPETLLQIVKDALAGTGAGGAARVLIVDDESAVRNFFRRVLTEAGWGVVVAEDGAAALKIANSQRFDLLLTDLVMPNCEGIEVIRRIRKEQPELKIIAVSGAFGGAFLEIARLLGASRTLAKPVTAEELVSAVREVLA